MAGIFMKIGNPGRKMLLFVLGFLVTMIVFYQFWVFPTEIYFSESSPGNEASLLVTIRSSPHQGIPKITNNLELVERVNYNASELGDDKIGGKDSGVVFDRENSDNNIGLGKDLSSMRKLRCSWNGVKQLCVKDTSSNHTKSMEDSHNVNALSPNSMDTIESVGTILTSLTKMNISAQQQPEQHEKHYPNVVKGSRLWWGKGGSAGLRNLTLVTKMNISAPSSKIDQGVQLEAEIKNRVLKHSLNSDSLMLERYVRKMRGDTVTLSVMRSMLLNVPAASNTVKRKWSSPRDRELVSASLQIKNAPILTNFPDLHAPLFRNATTFKRSYELMVRLLKVFVYKEGEKPIFHQPMVHGIYAAEGWFMKLMEKSKHFVVRDPKKAHLFYLPVSANLLRNTLHDRSLKDLELYLSGYLNLIKKKHQFWNRTGGADHFLVACHDWGPRITKTYMSNCIRALCNTNIARGFSIGKDVSVPVTYVRSANEPTRDIGGKPPSERRILAFFAGQMHGYVRPLLLKYWENKVSDMKIFGPMQLDVEGKAAYINYMKSSKFCICGRGYEVHTPRVVESIFYECVPVIISDNYVPPFFDVLDWEAFAVFVLEKDIPNLRNILLSIPEDRYLEMHLRVKMVQRHFIWHQVPEKYDLFHMILHSIWYSRVSQMGPI